MLRELAAACKSSTRRALMSPGSSQGSTDPSHRHFIPKSAFCTKGTQGPTSCSPKAEEGRLTTSQPKHTHISSPRLEHFTCDTAYIRVSPSPASRGPCVKQGDVRGAQLPLRSGQEEAPGSTWAPISLGATGQHPKIVHGPAEEALHQKTPHYRALSTMSLQDLVNRMAHRGLGPQQGFRAVETWGSHPRNSPDIRFPVQGDATTASPLAKGSVKPEETYRSIPANTLKDTHIYVCTTQPAALSPWIWGPWDVGDMHQQLWTSPTGTALTPGSPAPALLLLPTPRHLFSWQETQRCDEFLAASALSRQHRSGCRTLTRSVPTSCPSASTSVSTLPCHKVIPGHFSVLCLLCPQHQDTRIPPQANSIGGSTPLAMPQPHRAHRAPLEPNSKQGCHKTQVMAS